MTHELLFKLEPWQAALAHQILGGELPGGLTEITNTTRQPERICSHEDFSECVYITTAPSSFTRTIGIEFFDVNRNMVALMYGIEEYNQTQQFKAIMYGHRYWYDFHNQPRRNPTMRPLLHNGGKPR